MGYAHAIRNRGRYIGSCLYAKTLTTGGLKGQRHGVSGLRSVLNYAASHV